MPEPKLEIPKTPKQWICNIIASVLGEVFNKWVKKQIENRHSKVAVQKDLMIQMDPEIAKIFRDSTAVSSKYSIFNPNHQSIFICSEQGHLSQLALGWLKEAQNQARD